MASVLTLLSRLHARLGGSSGAPRLWRTARRIGRVWLLAFALRHELSRRNDITIVMGVRDRPDHRLVNALRSIRMQQYPAGLVRVIVVDYGSTPANGAAIARLAEEHRADYVVVEHAPVWSRSRSLNVGIRQADSKFLLTSDADIVLSPRYLSDAVAALKTSPLSIVCSPMFDLPEASVATLARAAETADLSVEAWKENAKPRHDWQFHPSICMAYTKVFKLIRGYDEYYELWGAEDDDLMRRLTYLGLAPKTLDTGSFYLHQWHPKFEGVPEAATAAQIRRNLAYLQEHHSIVRNDRDWGMPRA